MTLPAFTPRFHPAVFLRERGSALECKGEEELVLLDQVQMVALLACNIPVLSFLPFLKRLFHHMARHAEFRLFLCKHVILITYDYAEY